MGSISARHETATECVECKCTTAPVSGRSSYITRCRKLSLVGGSPETSRPLGPSFDNRAGSRRPSEEPVGVISQPSSVLTLILPDDPAVRPRAKIDWPIVQISSRNFASLIPPLLPTRFLSLRGAAGDG